MKKRVGHGGGMHSTDCHSSLCLKGYFGVNLIHSLTNHETVLDFLARDQVSRPLIYQPQKRPHNNNTLQ